MTAKVAATRLLAYDVLRDVEDRDAYANLALQARLKRQRLTPRDAAFVTELVSQTLRLQGKYDAIIALAAGREIAAIDARTRRVLRLGAHQLLQMRVPQHAALHESVELQKLVANQKAAGFVNAVLRQLSRRTLAEWESAVAGAQPDSDSVLAVQHSHPKWVLRALKDALRSDQQAQTLPQLLAADNEPPLVQLAVLPQPAAGAAAALRQRAVATLPQQLHATGASPLGLSLQGIQPAQALAQLEAAGIVARVQDQGSQLAALTLIHAKELRDGEKWLDLCAGPGGKTALLAAHAGASGVDITLRANEVAAHRAKLVQQAVTAAGAAAVACTTVVNHDGTTQAAYANTSYDRIMVDAPCSGLGALRRRPEARWRKQPSDIPALVQLQEQLLTQAVQHLAPGGVLAYVTCSPHLAETKTVVQRLLRRNPQIQLLDTAAVLAKLYPHSRFATNSSAASAASGDGTTVQLWPHLDDTDAMFIALFENTAA